MRPRYDWVVARLRRVEAGFTGAAVVARVNTTRDDWNVRKPWSSNVIFVWNSFTRSIVPSPYWLCDTRAPLAKARFVTVLSNSRGLGRAGFLHCTSFRPFRAARPRPTAAPAGGLA